MILLEVCANSVASALAAQDGGALRVELCANLEEGGTTPSYARISLVRKALQIKLYVLIRPRAGDFLYTELEFEEMKADIGICAELGCDGVVFGILKSDGSVDAERCGELLSLAGSYGLAATFHRAFDVCTDPLAELETIIDLGFERILTSGAADTAIEGSPMIASLVKQAGNRIIIMPGSGVSEDNINALAAYTGATEFHSSAKTSTPSAMQFINAKITTFSALAPITKSDSGRVRRMLKNAGQKN